MAAGANGMLDSPNGAWKTRGRTVQEAPQLPFINSSSTANSTQIHQYAGTGIQMRNPTQLLTNLQIIVLALIGFRLIIENRLRCQLYNAASNGIGFGPIF
jgi:hypothetical protein